MSSSGVDPAPRGSRLVHRWLLLALGFSLVFVAAKVHREGRLLRRGIAVPATIEALHRPSELAMVPLYSYEFEGERHLSDRVTIAPWRLPSPVSQWLESLTSGDPIEAWVDPDHPEFAYLERTPDFAHYFALLCFGTLLILTSVPRPMAPRPVRKNPDTVQLQPIAPVAGLALSMRRITAAGYAGLLVVAIHYGWASDAWAGNALVAFLLAALLGLIPMRFAWTLGTASRALAEPEVLLSPPRPAPGDRLELSVGVETLDGAELSSVEAEFRGWRWKTPRAAARQRGRRERISVRSRRDLAASAEVTSTEVSSAEFSRLAVQIALPPDLCPTHRHIQGGVAIAVRFRRRGETRSRPRIARFWYPVEIRAGAQAEAESVR